MSLIHPIVECGVQGLLAALLAAGGATDAVHTHPAPFPAEAAARVTVRDVRFQGNKALSAAELRAALGDVDLLRQPGAACARVAARYREAGFPAAHVSCEVQWFMDSDEVRVRFAVEEGER